MRRVVLLSVLAALPARAEVFVRWRHTALPPPEVLGVRTLVLEAGGASESDARQKGYRVSDAAGAVSGKWPRIRSNVRMRRNQPVQVGSRTAQPWLDNNIAQFRIREFERPGERPIVMYSWSGQTPGEGPRAEDYALAVAEAGAFGGDLVLDIDATLERGLASGAAEAERLWAEVRRYLDFYARKTGTYRPVSNVGVLCSDTSSWYEALNLLARHNVFYRLVGPGRIEPREAEGLDLVIAADSRADTSSLPREKVLPAGDDAADPNAFALKVRNILGKKRRLVDIWNGITVLVALARDPEGRALRLDLVNYAQQQLPVQVRVRGVFHRVAYESPEQASQLLPVENIDGFTEFVVPELRIGGTVDLRPE